MLFVTGQSNEVAHPDFVIQATDFKVIPPLSSMDLIPPSLEEKEVINFLNRVVLESDWRPLLNLKPNASMPPCNNALALIYQLRSPHQFFCSDFEQYISGFESRCYKFIYCFQS